MNHKSGVITGLSDSYYDDQKDYCSNYAFTNTGCPLSIVNSWRWEADPSASSDLCFNDGGNFISLAGVYKGNEIRYNSIEQSTLLTSN